MRRCGRPGRRRGSQSSSPHLLHEFEPCEAEHQPFRTELLKIDVHARVRSLALDVEHYAFAKFAMPHPRSEAHGAGAGVGLDAAAAAVRATLRRAERARE